jgi:integrase
MAASVKLVHRLSKKSTKTGLAPIYLRITKDRKTRFISTGVNVGTGQWNEDKQIVVRHDLTAAYNKKLTILKHKAESEVHEDKSAELVKKTIVGSTGDFVQYFEAYLQKISLNKQYWEVRKFAVLLRKMRRCLGNKISWRHLDKNALEKFESYLRSELGNNPNTIKKEMARLRRLCNLAVQDGVLPTEANPFIRYAPPKGRRVERRKLSTDEIKLMVDVDLAGSLSLELTRDAFLLSFYGGGVRFGDLCTLTVEEASGGRLRYRAMKTGSVLSVPLPDPANAIIGKYANGKAPEARLLPLIEKRMRPGDIDVRRAISSANVIANKNLKRIASLAGIEPNGLTTHIARHSFADFARRMGGDIHSIKQVLGHSDITVTQVYLKSLDEDAVDQLAGKMWGQEE